jgi:hypothetical protein
MAEIASFDVGRYVECDMCGEVLTDDPRSGGFMFSGNGVGPCCAERVMGTVERYGEQDYIRGYCPPGTSFADWIREIRGQTPNGNRMRIWSGLPWVGGDGGG